MRKSIYNDDAARSEILSSIRDYFDADVVTNKQLNEFVGAKNVSYPYFILRERKVGRGKFNVSTKVAAVAAAPPSDLVAQPAMAANVVNIAQRRAASTQESFVPQHNPTYVPFGFHSDLKSIIKSGIFYPVYITGLSGNGKTLMVEQVCAQLNRELIRVNVTKRTDETDLIGSYELIDGSTVRREGPVITAMRRGAVLLLDETDYGTEDLLCLQPILEGKPYFDKKSGDIVHPAPGFTVIATANTKGKGSEDGRFIGANVLNEAFLERFAITVEQEYPSASAENKILLKNFSLLGLQDDVFVTNLINWADIIRKSYMDGAVDEVISTRRLVHIARAYSIFKDRMQAIKMCLNRFDNDTKSSFLDLYSKIDATVAPPETSEAPATEPIEDQTDTPAI